MKIYCLFEQSNTFRDVFRSLGYDCDSYDIDGNPSYKIDLFDELNRYENGFITCFDSIQKGDFVIAFFPCTYFEINNQMFFDGTQFNIKDKSLIEKLEIASDRETKRHNYYYMLNLLIRICLKKECMLVVENPYSHNYLLRSLPVQPQLIITDRTLYGDKFKKPTMFYFFNCMPYPCAVYSHSSVKSTVASTSYGIKRSLISKEFAEIFVKDILLGGQDKFYEVSSNDKK